MLRIGLWIAVTGALEARAAPPAPGPPPPGWRLEVQAALPDYARTTSWCGPDAVLAQARGIVVVWDPHTQRQRVRLRDQRSGAAACTGDGRWAATGGLQLTLWDLATGQPVRTWSGHDATIVALAFSPDGTRLASTDQAGTTITWSVPSGRPAATHRSEVRTLRATLSFAPDGGTVVVAGDDGRATILSARTGEVVRTLRHPLPQATAAFTPDGQRIVTHNGGRLHFWSAATGERLESVELPLFGFNQLDLSPDGQRMVVRGSAAPRGEADAVVFDTATWTPVATYPGPMASYSVAFAPDGDHVAVGEVVFDARTADVTARLERMVSQVSDFAWSPGHLAMSRRRGESHEMLVWDLRADQPATFETDWRRGTALSAAGDCVRWVGSRGELREPGCRTPRAGWGVGEEIVTVAISPDGSCIATAVQDRTIRLSRACSPGERTLTLGDRPRALRFSDDGQRLLSTSRGRGVEVWDVASGRRTASLDGPDDVFAVDVSPAGVVAGTFPFPQETWVWDLATGEVTAKIPVGGTTVDLSADGTLVLIGGSWGDQTLVWDLERGEVRARLGRPADRVRFVADDARMLTLDSEGGFVWDSATGRQLAELHWLADGSWVVLDAEGRFDHGPRAPTGVYWVGPTGWLDLDVLEATHRDPGLLQKLLGHRSGPLRLVPPVGGP